METQRSYIGGGPFASSACAAAASAFAQSHQNAQILSVQQSGYGANITCTVVIRIKGSAGKQPRVVKRTFTL